MGRKHTTIVQQTKARAPRCAAARQRWRHALLVPCLRRHRMRLCVRGGPTKLHGARRVAYGGNGVSRVLTRLSTHGRTGTRGLCVRSGRWRTGLVRASAAAQMRRGLAGAGVHRHVLEIQREWEEKSGEEKRERGGPSGRNQRGGSGVRARGVRAASCCVPRDRAAGEEGGGAVLLACSAPSNAPVGGPAAVCAKSVRGRRASGARVGWL